MKTNFLILLITIVFSYCTSHNKNSNLTGIYFGLETPKNSAEMFAPGIVSTSLNDRDQTFSPDLNEIIFSVLDKPHSVLVSMKNTNGQWSSQQILPFSGKYNDCEPQFSPDGRRLYFCSDRPRYEDDDRRDYDIWYVIRSDSGWNDPINPGGPLNTENNEFYPSITKTGTLYFTSHDMKIYKSCLTKNGFTTPEMLSDSINSGIAEYNAFISPDESYLIFTSHGWSGGREGRGDLFISFNKGNNIWTGAVNLGPGINSNAADMSPAISPDSKYLFFASFRTPDKYGSDPITSYEEIFENINRPGNGKSDIYWVSTSVIDSLKLISY